MCAIALDEAFGMCGNNDAIFQQIAMMMGIRSDALASVTPLKEKYQNVLISGPGATDKTAARWVIARAWDLTINEKFGIMDAFNQAWEESDEKQGKGPAQDALQSATGTAQIDDVPEDALDDFPDDVR
jgi:hypothetical protein